MRLRTSYHTTTRPEKLMEIVDKVAILVKKLREDNPGLTHLVATGSSGQAVAWPVSYKLGIPVCVVRKPVEGSHDGDMSGTGDLGNYIIIDDLIASGATIRRVVEAIDKAHAEADSYGLVPPMTPVCIGIVLYQSDRGGEFNVNEEYGQPSNFIRVYGDNYGAD